MELRIVNADPKYSAAELIEPTPYGYLHLAAEVRSPKMPFMPTGKDKTNLLGRIKNLAHELQQLESVRQVSVFDAVAVPPVQSRYLSERGDSVQRARFDVVTLIETTSPDSAREVEKSQPYQALYETLISRSKRVHILAARNAKRIADVKPSRKGLFLFNYFVADDVDVMLQLWDYLARWYEMETQLDNSLLLVPLQGERSDYVAINHARWDISLPRFLARQLPKKTFRSFVLANLEANRVGSMPIMYRLA